MGVIKYSILIIAFILFGCAKKENNTTVLINEQCSQCGNNVIIDSTLFNTLPNDPITITSANINGDCLYVNTYYSGGCFESLALMIGKDKEQMRISFNDNDNCEAIVYLQIQCNLTPFRVGNGNVSIINLDGWGQLTYNY